VHQEHVASILALADLEGQRRQERRSVDAIAGKGASDARSAVNSSGVAAIRSISAFSGSFNAEFKWISPSPNAHDEVVHKKDRDKKPANSFMRGIVTDIFSPRILLGERLNFIVR
jgi:hypothetical protein